MMPFMFLTEVSDTTTALSLLAAGNAAQFGVITVLLKWLLKLIEDMRLDNARTEENTRLKDAITAQGAELVRLTHDLEFERRRANDALHA